MPRLSLKTLPLLVLLPVSLGAQEPGPKSQPGKRSSTSRSSPTRRIQRLTYDFKAAGKKMEYGLFVPSSYKLAANSKKRFPLIVALHGLGSNPQQILRYPGLVGLAEKHGYVVVAPMGYNSTGWYGVQGQRSRFWKPTNLGELSEKDVLNVIELARRAYPLDENRLYLLGHSMGGGGTLHLAIKDPSPWAALAPIAPAYYLGPAALVKIKKLPVIMVQGDRDLLVRVTMIRPLAEKMKELKMDVEYIEVKGGGHLAVAFDNLPRIFEFFNKHKRVRE